MSVRTTQHTADRTTIDASVYAAKYAAFRAAECTTVDSTVNGAIYPTYDTAECAAEFTSFRTTVSAT